MSMIAPGEDRYHYSDGSHRWIAPSEREQPGWDRTLQAHMACHNVDRGSLAPRARDRDPESSWAPLKRAAG